MKESKGHKAIVYILLIVGSLLMIIPFYWMVNTSLKTESEVFRFPPTWFAENPSFKSYKGVLTRLPFMTGIWNSFYTTALATIGTVFFSAITAYAFAKLQFRFKKSLFGVYLLSMMVPFQITLIPQFVMYSKIGWVNSHLPIIIPYIFTNGFGVFMLRQFFDGVPNALGESARIDGCNQFTIFSRIMLPLVKPALASVAVFAIINRWNDFLGPYVLLSDHEKYTIPILINSLQGLFSSNWTQIMAATTMAMIPMLIVYIFAQKYFIEGIALSGIKG